MNVAVNTHEIFIEMITCLVNFLPETEFLLCFSFVFIGVFMKHPTVLLIREGTLLEGDQILAINGQRIDTGLSHQEAIGILQRAQGSVEIIVARGEIHQPLGVSRTLSNASSSFITRTNSGASSSSRSSAPVTIQFLVFGSKFSHF